ncbi:MAG: hypothetical protein M0Z36_14660 [Thermaerobacter sp.]|nr:hypothetical protein [Thermaerobacter sp.]
MAGTGNLRLALGLGWDSGDDSIHAVVYLAAPKETVTGVTIASGGVGTVRVPNFSTNRDGGHKSMLGMA